MEAKSDNININSIQYGENNHIEYKWSNIQEEKILQLSFQLVRTTDREKRYRLAIKFRECFETGTDSEKKILLKLLAYTRDIEEGKGEYALTHCILSELGETHKTVCLEFIKYIVGYETTITPYGSWKDIKYLLNELENCPSEVLDMMNDQLRNDKMIVDTNTNTNTNNCSLVAKWIPREKSKKFGWINKELAKNYYPKFGKNGWTKAALNKARTHYRKILSHINKHIDTVQIKQCGNKWKDINFDKVTSNTMLKQKKAFLNDTIDTDDRKMCCKNILEFMKQVESREKTMKGSNTSIVDLVKHALNVNDDTNKTNERNIINEIWKSNSSNTPELANMIAMVDTSESMEYEDRNPLYSAIGLGCRVAEKSKLGRRVLTFNNRPSWINLENSETLCDMVKTINDVPCGMNANIYKAMNLIIDGIVETKMDIDEVNKLVLVVFSDMQFDRQHDTDTNDTKKIEYVREIIDEKFHSAGMRICGKAYKAPHIIFWNLRSTDGFPELSYRPGYSMMSGYSSHPLNIFTQKELYGIESQTPWKMLKKTLNNKRYNILEQIIV